MENVLIINLETPVLVIFSQYVDTSIFFVN